MVRRPMWLATGIVIGVGGTLWTEQRVRRALRATSDRLAPDHALRQAARSAAGMGQRVRSAGVAAATERRRHEAELAARLHHGGRHPRRSRAGEPGGAT